MWMPIASAPRPRAARSIQSRSTGGSICTWIGSSPTAALTASTQRARCLAPRSGPLDVPVVITIWRTPSRRTAAAATSASCSGRLTWVVAPAAQRLLDRAEPAAGVGRRVADAGLDDGRREDVAAVQAGELLVRDAVGGLEVVEPRPLDRLERWRPRRRRRPASAGRRRRSSNGESGAIGRVAAQPPLHLPVTVVARPGAGPPPDRRRRPQSADGELGAQRQLHRPRTSRSC